MKIIQEKMVVVAAFVLTFAAGVLTGAIIVREFAQRPFPRSAWRQAPIRSGQHFAPPLEILQQRLELDDAQQKQIAAILEKHREQIRQHLSQVRQPMRILVQQMVAEIDSVLTPEQREKFHKEFPRWWGMPPRHKGGPPPPFEMPP